MIDFTTILQRFFENPDKLLWLIPLLLILYILIKIDFVKLNREDWHKRKKPKRWLFISRLLIMGFLILALSTPYITDRFFGKGDASLTLLIDDSQSFEVFDKESVIQLQETLAQYTNVKTTHFGDEEKTPLGDTILDHLQQDGSMLVITDGHNNYGTPLREVLLQATTMNSTISALVPRITTQDSAITIQGLDKVSPGVDTQYTIKITGTENKQHHVTLTIDGQPFLDKQTAETNIDFIQSFTEGTHRLTATLQGTDHYAENNVYHKTVKVIKKPDILFYTQTDSPLVPLLQQLYEVTQVNELTNVDKNKYYAVVLNNIPTPSQETTNALNDYLSSDNGVLVIGGNQAFDKSSYKRTSFEDILPTTTGIAAEKEGGIVNIVIAIDISKSVSVGYGQGTVADVEKAIAISTIENLEGNHQVGVIAFNTEAYVVHPLMSLSENKEAIKNSILSLTKTGDSYVPEGLVQAMNMIDKTGGAKNILLISDGKSGGMGLAPEGGLGAKTLAEGAKQKGITIYGVGVGDPCIKYNKRTGSCEQWSNELYGVNAIKAIAQTSGGTYFHGQEIAQRVKILFGNAEGGESKEAYSLRIQDESHFITQNTGFNKKVTGFNNVLPKTTANLLITTETGEPLLTVWRYGIGRVATISTDDGSIWAGQLLQEEETLFFTKTLNWLIGDPEKKNQQFVYIQDTNIGRSTDVLVKDIILPTAKGLTFYKKEKELYSATYTPTEVGFQKLLGEDFAVNYNKELEALGKGNELDSITTTTGGTLYTTQNINDIIAKVTTRDNRPEENKWYLDWILILLALLLYLLELIIRRIREHKSI